jgi:hypothetical protein
MIGAFKFVGSPHLPVSRALNCHRQNRLLDLQSDANLEDFFPARKLLQSQFTAVFIKLLEVIETVSGIAHHFARLRNITQSLS